MSSVLPKLTNSISINRLFRNANITVNFLAIFLNYTSNMAHSALHQYYHWELLVLNRSRSLEKFSKDLDTWIRMTVVLKMFDNFQLLLISINSIVDRWAHIHFDVSGLTFRNLNVVNHVVQTNMFFSM